MKKNKYKEIIEDPNEKTIEDNSIEIIEHNDEIIKTNELIESSNNKILSKIKFSFYKSKNYWKETINNFNLKLYWYFYNKVNNKNNLDKIRDDLLKTDEAINVNHLFMKYHRKQKEYVIKDCNFIVKV